MTYFVCHWLFGRILSLQSNLKSSCNLNKIPHMCVGHQDTVMPQVGIGTWFYGVLTPANKFARGTHYYRNDL